MLRATNAALAAIYRRLVGGLGDARLAYADDRLLLFSDGITLHVRRAGAGRPSAAPRRMRAAWGFLSDTSCCWVCRQVRSSLHALHAREWPGPGLPESAFMLW